MSGTISRLNRRTGRPDPRPRVLEVGDADDVLDALASETGRHLFEALNDEPATTSEVAERVDTSVQNVHYHLQKLQGAELIEPVDTLYSDRGNEMTVYGPASDPIVLVGEGPSDDLEGALTRIAGGVGLLALASLVVQLGAEALAPDDVATSEVIWPASRAPPGGQRAVDLFGPLIEILEPGVLFFLGGCFAAAVVALWLRTRR